MTTRNMLHEYSDKSLRFIEKAMVRQFIPNETKLTRDEYNALRAKIMAFIGEELEEGEYEDLTLSDVTCICGLSVRTERKMGIINELMSI